MKKKSKVIVCIVTYNHEQYIEDCINSILSQKCNFLYEVHLFDDCSIDKTLEISNKYKDLITIHSSVKNFGIKEVAKKIYPFYVESDVPYGCFIEGDDYWIDEYKLQKQVEFMDANSDCSECFTNAYNFFENSGEKVEYIDTKMTIKKDRYTQEDMLFENFIPTATIMFRTKYLKYLPDYFYELDIGDRFLHVFFAEYGSLKFIDEFMAIRRVHSKGITSIWEREKNYKVFEEIYDALDKFTKYKYHELFDIFKIAKKEIVLNTSDMQSIEKILEFPWGDELNSSLPISQYFIQRINILRYKLIDKFRFEKTLKEILSFQKKLNKIDLKFAVFGYGKSGKMSIDFIETIFPESIVYIVDDNIKENSFFITTEEFLNFGQYRVDLLVYGKYQNINSLLFNRLKIPYLKLEHII